ncbi:MAG: holo-ACP synthase [Planctomycetota bacterium]|nr:holo-ACP synthase [Planctomycetota bacterium]
MTIIGNGIDLVDVKRIRDMVERHGQRFLDRCFTKVEQAYCDDAPRRRFEHYAARFAAKEAALKVLGTGLRDGIAWTDLEIVREPSGKPKLVVSGRCAEIATEQGIDHWMISLSHTETLATAMALGIATPSSGCGTE